MAPRTAALLVGQKTLAESVAAAKKLPKAVLKAREVLSEKGMDINGNTLKTCLSSKDYNNLSNVFRQSMAPSARAENANLNADEERRQWIGQFVLDPEYCQTEGFNKNTAFITDECRQEVVWLTQAQLESAAWLNSSAHAEALVESGELEERPHEYEVLARQNVKQFKFSHSLLSKITGHKQEAGTEAKAELTSKQYVEVTEDLSKSLGKPVKRKQPPKQKEPESEECKKLKATNQRRSSTLRKYKQQMDRAAGEVRKVEADLQKLPSKGYPDAMTQWLHNKLEELKAVIQIAQQRYAKEVTTVLDYMPTHDDIEKSCNEMDQWQKDLGEAYQDFKDGAHADVRKLGS